MTDLGKHLLLDVYDGTFEQLIDHEFMNNIKKIQNTNECNGCWNNKNFQFDAGDWDWCPIHKNTEKQHICQKSITPERVYKEIKQYLI